MKEQRAKAELARKAEGENWPQLRTSRKPAVANSLSGVGSPPQPKAVAPLFSPIRWTSLLQRSSNWRQQRNRVSRVAAANPRPQKAKAKASSRKDAKRVSAKREAAAKPNRHARAALRKRQKSVHVVRRGDTLWKIARRYYRAGTAMRRLYRANRGAIAIRIASSLGQAASSCRTSSENADPRVSSGCALSAGADTPSRGRRLWMWTRLTRRLFRPPDLYQAAQAIPCALPLNDASLTRHTSQTQQRDLLTP